MLIIPSLEGDSIEDYAVRVAQTWKLGRKGADDGVLFLVVTQDRKMRIDVGYGLEPRLTDLITRRILDERVRPRFRQNDYDGGIEAGVDAIEAVIAGQPLPGPLPTQEPRWVPYQRTGEGKTLTRLFVLAICIVVIGTFSLVALCTPGAHSWAMYVFLAFFCFLFPTVLFPPYGGLFVGPVWIIGYPILRHRLKPWSKDFAKRHPGLAGFGSGGGGSGPGGSWSGGDGGNGGGFFGDGGSFGGGGASGDW